MANSLIPDFPITTAEAPRQNLSKSDIAAPMREHAEGAGQKHVGGFDFCWARRSTLCLTLPTSAAR